MLINYFLLTIFLQFEDFYVTDNYQLLIPENFQKSVRFWDSGPRLRIFNPSGFASPLNFVSL